MSRPGIYNWNITAGDDEAVVFTFRDLTHDPSRLWTAQVRRQPGTDGTPAATCSTISAPGEGSQEVVTIALDDLQTRELGDLRLKCLYWDLQVVEAGSPTMTTTVIKGAVELDQDVTR